MSSKAEQILAEKVQDEIKTAYDEIQRIDKHDKGAIGSIVNNLVDVLQQHYKKAKERGDVLVPSDSTCIRKENPIGVDDQKLGGSEAYFIAYGFNKPRGEFSPGYIVKAKVSADTIIDRLGPDSGKYASPVSKTGKAYSVAERALPYLFLEKKVEKEPSYHVYRVKQDFDFEVIKQKREEWAKKTGDPLQIVSTGLLNSMAESEGIIFGGVASVPCFLSQGDGGGEQYFFNATLDELLEYDLIEEVIK